MARSGRIPVYNKLRPKEQEIYNTLLYVSRAKGGKLTRAIVDEARAYHKEFDKVSDENIRRAFQSLLASKECGTNITIPPTFRAELVGGYGRGLGFKNPKQLKPLLDRCQPKPEGGSFRERTGWSVGIVSRGGYGTLRRTGPQDNQVYGSAGWIIANGHSVQVYLQGRHSQDIADPSNQSFIPSNARVIYNGSGYLPYNLSTTAEAGVLFFYDGRFVRMTGARASVGNDYFSAALFGGRENVTLWNNGVPSLAWGNHIAGGEFKGGVPNLVTVRGGYEYDFGDGVHTPSYDVAVQPASWISAYSTGRFPMSGDNNYIDARAAVCIDATSEGGKGARITASYRRTHLPPPVGIPWLQNPEGNFMGVQVDGRVSDFVTPRVLVELDPEGAVSYGLGVVGGSRKIQGGAEFRHLVPFGDGDQGGSEGSGRGDISAILSGRIKFADGKLGIEPFVRFDDLGPDNVLRDREGTIFSSGGRAYFLATKHLALALQGTGSVPIQGDIEGSGYVLLTVEWRDGRTPTTPTPQTTEYSSPPPSPQKVALVMKAATARKILRGIAPNFPHNEHGDIACGICHSHKRGELLGIDEKKAAKMEQTCTGNCHSSDDNVGSILKKLDEAAKKYPDRFSHVVETEGAKECGCCHGGMVKAEKPPTHGVVTKPANPEEDGKKVPLCSGPLDHDKFSKQHRHLFKDHPKTCGGCHNGRTETTDGNKVHTCKGCHLDEKKIGHTPKMGKHDCYICHTNGNRDAWLIKPPHPQPFLHKGKIDLTCEGCHGGKEKDRPVKENICARCHQSSTGDRGKELLMELFRTIKGTLKKGDNLPLGVKVYLAKPKSHETAGFRNIHRTIQSATPSPSCKNCHEQGTEIKPNSPPACSSCHEVMDVRSISPHEGGWYVGHRKDFTASRNPTSCATGGCHTGTGGNLGGMDYCIDCHTENFLGHRPGWIAESPRDKEWHAIEAQRNPALCTVCHGGETGADSGCSRCHSK